MGAVLDWEQLVFGTLEKQYGVEGARSARKGFHRGRHFLPQQQPGFVAGAWSVPQRVTGAHYVFPPVTTARALGLIGGCLQCTTRSPSENVGEGADTDG